MNSVLTPARARLGVAGARRENKNNVKVEIGMSEGGGGGRRGVGRRRPTVHARRPTPTRVNTSAAHLQRAGSPNFESLSLHIPDLYLGLPEVLKIFSKSILEPRCPSKPKLAFPVSLNSSVTLPLISRRT